MEPHVYRYLGTSYEIAANIAKTIPQRAVNIWYSRIGNAFKPKNNRIENNVAYKYIDGMTGHEFSILFGIAAFCAKFRAGAPGPTGALKVISMDYIRRFTKFVISEHFSDFALHGCWEALV